MAKIVLGMGTSHGPMLSTPPEEWGQRAIFDRQTVHHYQGRTWSFDELAETRKGRFFDREITLDIWRNRHAACRRALAKLAEVFAEVSPDIVVIVGNDHMEMFDESTVPAFSIFWGDSIVNNPYSEEHMARLAPGVAIALPGHIPPGGASYPCLPALGRHLIASATHDGFEVAAMKQMPHNETPHAYGFVYRQLMQDRAIPCVPVALNTYYPPNQPTIRRCYDFGKALVHAIKTWDSDARVAIIASGGLSHFVIDEDVDGIFIDSLRDRTIDRLADLGEAVFQSGTSEVKNWVPVAGAMAELGFDLTIVDYVPCYRSIAGTGNAMGFVYWRP
jgi:Catalytic LigB subunit of aromatic ring-opening dioxygenase